MRARWWPAAPQLRLGVPGRDVLTSKMVRILVQLCRLLTLFEVRTLTYMQSSVKLLRQELQHQLSNPNRLCPGSKSRISSASLPKRSCQISTTSSWSGQRMILPGLMCCSSTQLPRCGTVTCLRLPVHESGAICTLQRLLCDLSAAQVGADGRPGLRRVPLLAA